MILRILFVLLLAAVVGCQHGPSLESTVQAQSPARPQFSLQQPEGPLAPAGSLLLVAAEPAGPIAPAGAAKPAQPVPPPPAPAEPDTAERLERLLDAVQLLHDRVDMLQSQNRRLLAALGVDEQDPAAPPSPTSLAGKVADLQQAVMMLSDTDAALRRAIEESRVTLRPLMPEPVQGRLIVDNHTGSDRQIWINGSPHWVWAGSRLTVNVPVGEVTTKVAGEQAKSWQIAEPDYQEHIELVRAEDAVGT